MTSLETKKLEQKYNFYRQAKLTKTDEFSSVFNFKRRFYSEHLVLNFRPNGLKNARLGLVVAKKMAKTAVSRNYIRRVLRELFRNNQSFLGAYDLVINVRKKFTKCHFFEINGEFNQLTAKLALQKIKMNTAQLHED